MLPDGGENPIVSTTTSSISGDALVCSRLNRVVALTGSEGIGLMTTSKSVDPAQGGVAETNENTEPAGVDLPPIQECSWA